MNRNSNKKGLPIYIPILAGLFLAKALWVAVDYKFLPKTGVDKELKSTVKPLYYRYALASKKEAPKSIVKKRANIKVPIKKKHKPKAMQIKKFVLKGVIYENPDSGIATIKYKEKSYVLAKGEKLEGFELSKFAPTSVTFVKDSKSYVVNLFSAKKKKKSAKRQPNKHMTPFAKKQPNKKKHEEKKAKKAIITEDDTTVISKNLFDKYKKDINLIKQNIGVAPFMENNKLKGFKVKYIKSGSDFAKLGVQTGDIITAINGEEITDLSVPLNFFNNLETITNATITIKRGNEEKELEYEVR